MYMHTTRSKYWQNSSVHCYICNYFFDLGNARLYFYLDELRKLFIHRDRYHNDLMDDIYYHVTVRKTFERSDCKRIDERNPSEGATMIVASMDPSFFGRIILKVFHSFSVCIWCL